VRKKNCRRAEALVFASIPAASKTVFESGDVCYGVAPTHPPAGVQYISRTCAFVPMK
jgi:hypothetical protein